MPYRDRKQAVAIFMDLKRRKGEQAANAFGRKHRADFKSKPSKRSQYGAPR